MSKILLIEDDTVLQQMYQDRFTQEQYEVQVSGDGGDGLAKMRSWHPDLVLLDLMLPTTSGFDVLDRVQEEPELKAIPILVLTNIFADGEDLVKNKGVKAFMLKANTTPDEIVAKVKGLLPQ